MNSEPTAFSAIARATRLGWLMLAFMLAPLAGWSQDDADEADGESSQHVEESEEAYRRRMELEEARDQADIIPDRTSGTLKAPEGIDALPYDSRKHLRDELRNVIIEQGEWQPEDANANYPYTPSAAAQKDPELRQQEEKAWGELIQEYHKREAAALESGGGRSSGSAPGQSQGSGQSGGQAGASGSENSKPGSPGSRSADSRPETEATSSTAGGAGVSQSALEFLKGQSGGQVGGQAAGQAGGQAGSQPSAAAGSPGSPQAGGQPPSSPSSTPAVGAEKTPAETQQQVAEAAASQSESASEDKSKDKEPSDTPPPPPGSLAIAELASLEEGNQRQAAEEQQAANKPADNQKAQEQNAEAENSQNQDAEQQQTQSVVLRNEAEQPPPRPGTLAIPELEKLKGLENEAPPPVKTP